MAVDEYKKEQKKEESKEERIESYLDSNESRRTPSEEIEKFEEPKEAAEYHLKCYYEQFEKVQTALSKQKSLKDRHEYVQLRHSEIGIEMRSKMVKSDIDEILYMEQKLPVIIPPYGHTKKLEQIMNILKEAERIYEIYIDRGEISDLYLGYDKKITAKKLLGLG